MLRAGDHELDPPAAPDLSIDEYAETLRWLAAVEDAIEFAVDQAALGRDTVAEVDTDAPERTATWVHDIVESFGSTHTQQAARRLRILHEAGLVSRIDMPEQYIGYGPTSIGYLTLAVAAEQNVHAVSAGICRSCQITRRHSRRHNTNSCERRDERRRNGAGLAPRYSPWWLLPEAPTAIEPGVG